MDKVELLNKLKDVEELAKGSKLNRLLRHPFKYFQAIGFREFVYKKHKKTKSVIADTFYGYKLNVLLPSSIDIYLTGGKTHFSEINLARFLIHELRKGDCFVDVGAHYGYFTHLACKLVGESGDVYAFEAAPTTFNVLSKSKSQFNNVQIFNKAVSDKNEVLVFNEFPNLFSEYNTLDIRQFEDEDWFKDSKPKQVKINSIVLGNFFQRGCINPQIIKIDMEGAEFKVINGLKQFFTVSNPIIIMEYLSEERSNKVHIQAELVLKNWGYNTYIINGEGKLNSISNVSDYLNENNLDSENIVFKKA